MRRIAFFEPGSPHAHVFKGFSMPRMGSVVLGTILERAGYDVRVYVDDILPPRLSDLADADLVCISTITTTAPYAYRTARALKGMGVPVVLGGPHVTFMPDEALEHADYVYRGEAERAIVGLVRAIETGRGLDEVPGLSFRSGREVRHNAPAVPVADLDELPDADLGLLHGGLRAKWGHTLVPVQTSRGCPHSCSFCSVTRMFGRRLRFRSVERVLGKLERLATGRSHVFFYDDHFAASHSRLRELCERMIGRGLGLDWSAQVRADVARDEGLVRLMKRSGCRLVYVGVESVNPETLKGYDKGQTVEEVEHAMEVFHRAGIAVHGMFALGADTDTVETVRATSRFARERGIGTAQFLVLTPLPGTPFYEQLLREGRLVIRDWRLFGGYHVVYEPARMTAHELQSEIVRAYGEFYSTPRILSRAARLEILPALGMLYARRMERRLARMNSRFLEGLAGGLDVARAFVERSAGGECARLRRSA
ncbi:MAG: B12-binding domain-containing radical SAM protein [Planctomycetota bacterium]|jgi:radical SAM superfamily enzyme YgiQ (UPF0313 family)